MNTYPFIFLNHGEIDVDSVDKCEECYIWFKRDVTSEERQIITDTCPPPLSGMFAWGECFAYFGSGGDTYDFDILACYGGQPYKKLNTIVMKDEFDSEEEDIEPYIEDRSKNFPVIDDSKINYKKFDEAMWRLLEICVPRMTNDLDKWAHDINMIVPIAFLLGPHGADSEDEWNRYSCSMLENALEYVKKYMENSPDAHKSSVKTEKANHKYNLLVEKERERYLGYIFNDVLRRFSVYEKDKIDNKIHDKEEIKKRLNLADMVYSMDGINEPVSRLSHLEHTLQTNCDIILSAIKDIKDKERLKYLNELLPYTQLAYYASYGALKNEDLLLHDDPAGMLKKLSDTLPDIRKKAATSLLSMIANNLIHVSPAYTVFDKKLAPAASLIFELIAFRKDAEENDYVTGTVCCEWASLPELGLKIAKTGLKKFPKSKLLLNNAVSVANLTGNKELYDKYLGEYEALSDKPDENFVLNKTFSLINTKKFKDALNVLDKYFESGGEKSPKILVNLCYLYQYYQAPPDDKMRKFVDETNNMIKKNMDYQDNMLLENYFSLISTKKYYFETIKLFEFLHNKNFILSPSCWVNYTYAAYFYTDKNVQKKVTETYEDYIINNESHLAVNPMSFANMASLYALLGNKNGAIKFVKLCKKHGYANFHTMENDEDLKLIHNEKDFKKLFD